MIILRQKEYSKATKLVAGLKGIKDKAGVAVSKVMTPIENAGLKAGNYVKEVVTGKPTPEHMKVGFRPKVAKTSMQIKREAVKDVRGAQEKAKKIANEVYYTPGQVIDKGVKYTAENPIAATGNAASFVLPTINPVFATVPVGTPSFAVEGAAKKLGAYKRGTQRMSNAWSRSGASKTLRSSDSLPIMASRFGQMIPL